MSRAAHATRLTSRHPCSGAVLRPPAPRQRVPSLRARPRTDAELRAGHRRTTPADRLHLGSIFDSCRGRRWEARCLAASDLRLHPPLSPSRGSTKAESRATPQGRERAARLREFSPLLRAVITLLPRPRVLRVDGGWGLVRAWLAPSLSPYVLPSSGLRVLSGGPFEIARDRRFETSSATSSRVASSCSLSQRQRANGHQSAGNGQVVSAQPVP
jgi:hypothetical protein